MSTHYILPRIIEYKSMLLTQRRTRYSRVLALHATEMDHPCRPFSRTYACTDIYYDTTLHTDPMFAVQKITEPIHVHQQNHSVMYSQRMRGYRYIMIRKGLIERIPGA